MTVKATGPLGNTIQKLEDLLAASSTFQAKTGASDVAAAKTFIFYMSWPGPDYQKAFAVIEHPEDASLNYAKFAPKVFIESGTHSMSLVAPYDLVGDEKDGFITVCNFIDSTIKDMLDIEGDSDNYVMNDVTVDGPYRVKREERESRGDYWQADITIGWNPFGEGE